MFHAQFCEKLRNVNLRITVFHFSAGWPNYYQQVELANNMTFVFLLWPRRKRHQSLPCFFSFGYCWSSTSQLLFIPSFPGYKLRFTCKTHFCKNQSIKVGYKKLPCPSVVLVVRDPGRPCVHSMPCMVTSAPTSFLVQPLCSQTWQGQHSSRQLYIYIYIIWQCLHKTSKF